MPDRAHVMELGQDFIDGHWDVSCFCGWSTKTLWDDREDAVADFERHTTASDPTGNITNPDSSSDRLGAHVDAESTHHTSHQESK